MRPERFSGGGRKYTRRNGRKYWIFDSVSRTIEVWCDEPSHDPVHLGGFKSEYDLPNCEIWRAAGPHVENQRTNRAGFRDGRRSRFRCPDCGLDVVAGDRIGGRGMRSIVDGKTLRGWYAGERTDGLLSRAADAGVSRLSLSALGRILTL